MFKCSSPFMTIIKTRQSIQLRRIRHGIIEFDFEQWAKAVQVQMLMALNRKRRGRNE